MRIAAEDGHIEIIKHLVDSKADENAADAKVLRLYILQLVKAT